MMRGPRPKQQTEEDRAALKEYEERRAEELAKEAKERAENPQPKRRRFRMPVRRIGNPGGFVGEF